MKIRTSMRLIKQSISIKLKTTSESQIWLFLQESPSQIPTLILNILHMNPSHYNHPKPSKLQPNYTHTYNQSHSNHNIYPNNFNHSYSQSQYNPNNYPPQYGQPYYPQGYQQHTHYPQGYQQHTHYPQGYQHQAHYYQPHYQQYPNQQQHQNYYQNNPNNLNRSYHNQQYANTPHVPTQDPLNASLNRSYQHTPKQHKNLSQSQVETKHVQENLSKGVVYQPGQHTNTYGQIPKEIGLPNWQNPYKESSVRLDQSRDLSYRSQQSSKVRMYREKPVQQVSQKFSDPFNTSFLSQVPFKPKERGTQDIGRFGGAKKKKKRQNVDQSIGSIQSIPAKKKEKSLAEQSSSMGYFTVKTEYVQTVKCPFDSSHIMQPGRLLTHISRCILKCETAKQYVMCPYDRAHYYRFDQIQAHKNTCDKKPQYVMEDFWNIGVDNLNQSTRPNISVSNISETNKECVAPPLSEPTHQLIHEDLERTQFENYLITDF